MQLGITVYVLNITKVYDDFEGLFLQEIINIPAKLCGLKCLIYEISDSFFLALFLTWLLHV